MTRRSRTLTTTKRCASLSDHPDSPTDHPAPLTDHPDSPTDLVPMAVLALVPFASTLALAYPTLAVVTLSALAGAAAHRALAGREGAQDRLGNLATRR